MFYKKGVDISNARSMYEFITNHFIYWTLNSWNSLESIANNVKIYNLKLEGDEWEVLHALERDDYFTVNSMIEDWEYEHKGYKVGFNGRSNGYLVLYNESNNSSVVPDHLYGYESYEKFKQDYTYYYGTMQDAKYELRECTKLIQDFDKLCDKIRDYVNELSKRDLKTDYLKEVVEAFNEHYYDDLKELGYKELEVVDGKVDLNQIKKLQCLSDAFLNMFDGDYNTVIDTNNHLYVE